MSLLLPVGQNRWKWLFGKCSNTNVFINMTKQWPISQGLCDYQKSPYFYTGVLDRDSPLPNKCVLIQDVLMREYNMFRVHTAKNLDSS